MTPSEPTTEATQKRWDTLTRSLARVGVVPGSVFGLPGLKFGKTPIAALQGNALVLKLEGHAHARALALEGAHRFDEASKPEWVVIPTAHWKEWGGLAATALTTQATTLPARRRPPKKWPGQR